MTTGRPSRPEVAPPPTGSPPAVAGWGWPVVRPVHPARVWAWGLLYWPLLGWLTLGPPRISGNVTSRYMTIEAIVERGSLAIERSPILGWSGSPDVVRFGPHLYSDKPPVLPALAAPVYGALRLGGVRMGATPREFAASSFALTWVVVGASSALTLVALRALLQAVDLAPWVADLATIAFGVASPLLTYGVTFNNHSVAAGCVAGAWAIALIGGGGRWRRSRRFAAGVLAGLAATIDLPIGCLSAGGVGLIVLRADPWRVVWFLAGLLGPLALHSVLQTLVTGSPLPAEMYPSAFEYPGSYWTTPAGRWRETGPRWRFGLDLLVGRAGVMTVSPALWFGAVGLVGAILARRGTAGATLRPAALVVGSTSLILLTYYTWGVRRTDFAGASWGVRHLLAASVMVYLFGLIALARLRGAARGLGWMIFALATAVGGVYAVEGMLDPWSRVETRAGRDRLLRVVQHGALFRGGTFRDERGEPIDGARP